MTPEERQLLSGLFDRIRNAAAQPRDGQAESFIADAVRSQPYAPYLLAQTVIVQDQALRAANDKLQELESKVQSLQGDQQGAGGGTSFLGNIGRTIFGQGSNEGQQRPPVPSAGYAQGGQGQGGYAQPQGGYAQPGPWGQGGGQFAQAGQGGGFLKGALGAAAGVAGGVLLANSISGLFHGNNSLGIASGMPGFGGGYPGGETIVNNYYGDEGGGGNGGDGGHDNAGDFGSSDGGMSPDDAGFGSDDGGFGSDDSYNV